MLDLILYLIALRTFLLSNPGYQNVEELVEEVSTSIFERINNSFALTP